jgi:E3 ubiquitin-protein ligase RFWD2
MAPSCVLIGSENNAAYAYYKGLPKPVLCHRFNTRPQADVRGVGGSFRCVVCLICVCVCVCLQSAPGAADDTTDDTSNFVSSVCWKQDDSVLLAANSQGAISVMALVP